MRESRKSPHDAILKRYELDKCHFTFSQTSAIWYILWRSLAKHSAVQKKNSADKNYLVCLFCNIFIIISSKSQPDGTLYISSQRQMKSSKIELAGFFRNNHNPSGARKRTTQRYKYR